MTANTESPVGGGSDDQTSEERTNYRYPGSPPFQDTELDSVLFKGRASEVDEVLNSILSSDLFVLFAISGMGKSSLLNAGVLHQLRDADYWPVSLRLNDPDKTPLALIHEAIETLALRQDDVEVMNDPSMPPLEQATTLWDYLAALEVWHGNKLVEPVLIFDQFEELFTLNWNAGERDEFISQFGEVARGHRRAREGDVGGQSGPPQIKLVIVIREDSLGELEAMAEHVPQILRQRFRLGPLDPEQATQAILDPAMVDNPLLGTRRFTYSDRAAAEILTFLGAQAANALPTQRQGVDPSQLQLVCQYVERTILPRKPDTGDDGTPIEISEGDLGGQEGLQQILGEFYRRTLDLFSGVDRENVSQLCEVGLINRNDRRLSLEEQQITDLYLVDRRVLERLVTERLLRGERRVGSVYYELAHDTLVPPIQEYRAERKAEQRAAGLRKRRRIFNAIAATTIVLLLIAAVWFRYSGNGDDEAIERVAVVEVDVAMLQGATLPNGITQAGDKVLYAFEAPADGDPVAILVVPATDTALDPAIEVTDPNDVTRPTQNQLSVAKPERIIVANIEGRYEFAVSGVSSSTGSFDVRILEPEVGNLTTEGPAQVPAGSGEIASPGDAEVFRADVNDGEALVYAVTPADGSVLDPVVDVIDPTGVVRRVNAAASGSITLSGVAGRYIVLVSGNSDSIGSFELERITEPSGSAVRTLEVDSAEQDQGFDAGVAVYSLEGSATDILTLEVVPTSSLDLALEVIDPNGSVLQSTRGGPGVAESVILSPLGGSHQVTVRSLSESSESSFSIGLARATIESLSLSREEKGTIEQAGQLGVLEFAAEADAVVSVGVTPDPELDVALEITGPDGSVQRGDDGQAGSPEAITLLAQEGNYRIVVKRSSESSGSWTMTVEPVDASIQILTPRRDGVGPRGVEVSGTVQPANADIWISVQGSDPDGVFFVGGFPVRAGSDGFWSALPIIGASSDEGFTFEITAFAMDETSSQMLRNRDFGGDVNQLVPLAEIPPALATDQVEYTREG